MARALGDRLQALDDRPGRLFLAITRHRTIVGTGMTRHAAYNVLAKRQREAGVAKLSLHDFRRTFVADLLDARGPLDRAEARRARRRGDEVPGGRGAPLPLPGVTHHTPWLRLRARITLVKLASLTLAQIMSIRIVNIREPKN